MPVVELLEEHLVQVDAQGRRQIRYRYVFRVDQESALEGWGSVSAEWSPWYEARPEIQARVITPDGQVHLLDAKTLGEYGAEDPDSTVFGDRKHLRGPLPKLGKGSIAEVFIHYREFDPFSKAGVRGRVVLSQNVPVARTRVELKVPAASPLKFKLTGLDGISPSQRTEGDWTTVSIELGPQDVPKATETNLPQDQVKVPTLAYSTVPSWSASAREYAEIVRKQVEGADLSAWVQKAIGNATTREQKIARLLQRLHREIRYTGVEFRDAAIIPTRPSETLKRGFGDCKDKSTLLVCLLRSAGIPAEVALLRSGTSPDVDPDLPGNSGFNHAIVFLPGGSPSWIDATAEFACPGQSVRGVEGRLALVASVETVELRRIPEVRSEENWQRETREVWFSESGPGRIHETTLARGWFEERYRSEYSRNDEKRIRESLLDYAKNSFSAKTIGKVSYSDGRDLAKPFELHLDIEETAAASIDLTNAAASVNPWSMVTRLQHALMEGRKEGEDQPPRAADLDLPEPYLQELAYRIHTPAGYVPDVLPSDRVVRFGPATLSMIFSKGQGGMVMADYRMDTGARRWTAAQVNEALKALKTFGDEKVIQVVFNQVGETHLAAGRIREAITEFRRLAADFRGKASPHTRVARAFLAAGLGEAARQEARKATRLDPTFAAAQETLGWVLQHDLLGRRFGKGWDLPGAVEAYRKAKALDSKSFSIRGDLAILLEHDADGRRYSPSADLDSAIREYQDLRTDLKNQSLDKNLVLTLAKKGRYQESVDLARGMPSSAPRDCWLVVGLVNLQGIEPALAESARLFVDAGTRRSALLNAGDELIKLRKYPEAARLLLEGSNGSDQRSQIRSRVELINRVRRIEPDERDIQDPASLVRQFFVTILRQSGDVGRIRAFFSPAISEHLDDSKVKEMVSTVNGMLRGIDLPPDALADLTVSLAQLAVDGDDRKGYRVQVRGLGDRTWAFFVTATGAGYRIVGSSNEPAVLGIEAMWQADHGNLVQARAWLDQARQVVPVPPGDDPLAGPLFSHFWTKGQEADGKAVKLAASTLLIMEKSAKATPEMKEARKETKDPLVADRLELAILLDAFGRDDWSEAMAKSERLVQAYPNSLSAAVVRAGALIGNKRWEEALRFFEVQMKDHPDFIVFREGRYEALKKLGKRGEMEKQLQDQIDRGHAEPNEYNNLAWSHVVRRAVTEKTLELIRTATQGNSKQSASIHTLATVLAELGRTTEAKDALVQELDLRGGGEPGTNEWYVLGRIAEHLGVPEAAKACYNRSVATGEAKDAEDGDSCRSLALRRLEGLKGV